MAWHGMTDWLIDWLTDWLIDYVHIARKHPHAQQPVHIHPDPSPSFQSSTVSCLCCSSRCLFFVMVLPFILVASYCCLLWIMTCMIVFCDSISWWCGVIVLILYVVSLISQIFDMSLSQELQQIRSSYISMITMVSQTSHTQTRNVPQHKRRKEARKRATSHFTKWLNDIYKRQPAPSLFAHPLVMCVFMRYLVCVCVCVCVWYQIIY